VPFRIPKDYTLQVFKSLAMSVHCLLQCSIIPHNINHKALRILSFHTVFHLQNLGLWWDIWGWSLNCEGTKFEGDHWTVRAQNLRVITELWGHKIWGWSLNCEGTEFEGDHWTVRAQNLRVITELWGHRIWGWSLNCEGTKFEGYHWTVRAQNLRVITELWGHKITTRRFLCGE